MKEKVSKEMKQAVARALDHNDFSQLNELIKKNETKSLDQVSVEKVLEKDNLETATKETAMEKTELEAIIEEGNVYIQKLKKLKAGIPTVTLPTKLNETEYILLEIFKQLKEHPTQIHKVHKLMDYYLPTTVKLVESYAKFEDVDIPSEDIIATKKEIEGTVVSLNEALAEMLSKIMQTDVFDASTDAQVLRTMLSKDGLLKSDFAEG